MYSITDCC